MPLSSHFPTKQYITNFQYRRLVLYNESMDGWMGGRFAWRLALIFFSFDFRDAWRMGSFHSTGRTWYNAAHLTGGGGTINEWLWREVEGAEREIKRVYIA